ncbi:MAG: ribose-phosphate pyrophosphokinase [Candidatus Micrarchaeota archaeon]|nr:ribose-phosphate pyrophosphokinase [Candidatus Micrarchaeota archaeon]
MVGNRIMLFAGNSNPRLAGEIASKLGIPLGKAKVARFSDGECNIQLLESVRGANAFIIQSLCAPVNENLMELLLLMDACRRASARRIYPVIPYYGYGRQDRVQERKPVSAKLVANMIQKAGADAVMTVDIHSPQIQGFFDIPMDNLSAAGLFTEKFESKRDGVVVVSPDVGGVRRARNFAEKIGASLAIIDKTRPRDNEAEVMNVIGDVKGKKAVIVDDIIDTGGTMVKGADALKAKGATSVSAFCTHPVLSGEALKKISASVMEELVVTNSIPLPPGAPPKIKALSLAPMLAETIQRIHEGKSISNLFTL